MRQDQVHFRRACDRCHRHKLRCKKDESADSCARCARAKVKCEFSPSLRAGRKQQQQQQQQREKKSQRQNPKQPPTSFVDDRDDDSEDDNNDVSIESDIDSHGGETQQARSSPNLRGSISNCYYAGAASQDPIDFDLDFTQWLVNDGQDSTNDLGRPDRFEQRAGKAFESYPLHPALQWPLNTAMMPTKLPDAASASASASASTTASTQTYGGSSISFPSRPSHSPNGASTPTWMTMENGLDVLHRSQEPLADCSMARYPSHTTSHEQPIQHRINRYSFDPPRTTTATTFDSDIRAYSATSGAYSTRRELWLRHLSEINIQLYQHAAIVMSRDGEFAASGKGKAADTRHFAGQRDVAMQDRGDDDSGSGAEVAVDQTFSITLRFLEMLHNVDRPREDSLNEAMDHSTLLLMFSSYLRLLDIYIFIFRQPLSQRQGQIRERNRAASSPPSASFAAYQAHVNRDHGQSKPNHHARFPSLNIGDFSLQSRSSIHTLLLIQLSEHLLVRIYKTMKHLHQQHRKRNSISSFPFSSAASYTSGARSPLEGATEYGDYPGSPGSRHADANSVADASLRAVQTRQTEVLHVLDEAKRILNSKIEKPFA